MVLSEVLSRVLSGIYWARGMSTGLGHNKIKFCIQLHYTSRIDTVVAVGWHAGSMHNGLIMIDSNPVQRG